MGSNLECKAALHHDPVNHPSHYKGSKLESIEVIEDFKLNFHLGNAVKYILRAGKKGNKIQDLRKAIWYLERECSGDLKTVHQNQSPWDIAQQLQALKNYRNQSGLQSPKKSMTACLMQKFRTLYRKLKMSGSSTT